MALPRREFGLLRSFMVGLVSHTHAPAFKMKNRCTSLASDTSALPGTFPMSQLYISLLNVAKLFPGLVTNYYFENGTGPYLLSNLV